MRDKFKVLGLTAAGFGLMMTASAWAAGSQDPAQAQPTPCATPAGAIFSSCSGVPASQSGAALGDNTSVPGATAGTEAESPITSPSASPSLTPGTMPSPEATVTPAAASNSTGGSGGGSGLPDTGAMTAVSSAIGLGAIGYAGWMYYKRRKLANEPVRPMRVESDPEVLDIAKMGA